MDMYINFGFAGMPGDCMQAWAYEKISDFIAEFCNHAQNFNCKKYGFSGQEIQCNLFSGDLFCTEEICTLAKDNHWNMNVVTSAYAKDSEKFAADFLTALDVKPQNLSYVSLTAEYVVNKSDAVFILWDGVKSLQEGVLWTVLQLCKQHQIPYYLINTAKPEEVSFSADAYYVPYSLERVQEYVAQLYDYEEVSEENTPIPLSGLWLKLYNRFMQKYKLKVRNIPYVEDRLLDEDYFPQGHPNAENHKMLTTYFNYYDQKATEAAVMYRASIYFRSILPFLTTIFIAIGFYAETVLGFLVGKPALFGMNVWTMIAGIGFLIHALLNLYSGQTARNPGVQRLRKDFVEARFIAEHLRIAIHGEVHGISVDSIRMNHSAIEQHVYAKLHHIIRQQKPADYVQTKGEMKQAMLDFNTLIADQLVYHENTIRRYELITKRLRKLAATLSGIGVTIVILRGILQFIIPFAAMSGNLSAEWHGIKVESFMKSFANMLALVLPAWASYFSTKLNMNSYAWQQNNSQKMKNGFLAIQAKMEDASIRKNPSYQLMNDIANDICSLTAQDYIGWYQHTDAQGFTRL